ncbi:ABC transporter substrate-binding protein [Chelatococcus daeguensis]|uniref:ABC transporter permease n=2 Tax=Chelatococcus TaxID=28209 RepID=A0AAC9P163_9HYPH|nr:MULTISPECIES: ABC transporter substrate-binding protein [Chelatococcus]APF39411.1 ABC transporter permease [Chelatococcus daeguensis]KZE29238.1 ABC transporter permease [Chelatococcus daeguensis]MBM3083958.1 ABC transporter substrate-binding protein [Chelatococcus daeguensis]CUA87110.1 ABC-type branched-chain amino acid transport system, periplasmic component [Chelatococcus sambhunathii]
MKTGRMLLATALVALFAGGAEAQVSVKLGVLNDRSGTYADLSGEGSVIAARMAVEDFKAKDKGINVEIVSADHQNKPDIGSNIARQWYDQDGVDVILDVPTSSVALAINQITREKNKIFINSGAAASDLTGKQCSPNTVHWTYDTWALANGTGSAMVKAGGDTWFFLTADYAFGHALERDTIAVVEKSGGKVLGTVRHPFPGSDFSSFLLQAQSSGAKVIGLANAGGDTINSIKQAAEFGITQAGQNLAGLLVFITDVNALGLQTAQGLVLTESFYWDLNDETRAFAKRFAEKSGGKMPTMVQAGVYAGTLHYLKAVEALKDKDSAKVMAKMKEMPTDDPLFGKGQVRADGRKIHDMYLFEVKKPEESKGPWDYYKLVATIPAAEAFRPLDQGECPLVKG